MGPPNQEINADLLLPSSDPTQDLSIVSITSFVAERSGWHASTSPLIPNTTWVYLNLKIDTFEDYRSVFPVESP